MFALFKNFNDLLKLAKDDSFKAFLSDPRVQKLMQDSEFKKAVEEKNVFKLLSHREFNEILQDPKMRTALEQISRKYGSSPS